VRASETTPQGMDSKVRSHSSSALIFVNLPALAVHKKIKKREAKLSRRESPLKRASNLIILI